MPAQLRDLRIGFLDVMLVPPVVGADRTVLVAFPDEVMFVRRPTPAAIDHSLGHQPQRSGTVSSAINAADHRTMVPNLVGLGVTETIVLALREAGLNAATYRTVSAAADAGVDLLIASVVRDRRVVFEDGPSRRQHVGTAPLLEASAELVATILDLKSGRMATRSLSTTVRIEPVFGPHDDGGANALLPVGEAYAQLARTVLTQAYYNIAMDLADSLRAHSTAP